MTQSVPWPALKRSLVAILRGLKPEETAETISVLIDAGFEAIEIPLNSPDPFKSIRIAVETAPDDILIGAGTVLSTADVDRLAEAGGTLMVSPNVDAEVINRARNQNMVTMPGVFSPTEALSAIKAGASGLKFFPAAILGPAGISAIKAVLPAEVEVGAVGGVSHADYATYGKIGVRTFGLGSSIYKPGMSVAEIGKRAQLSITAYDEVFRG
jgi:2-dehydro-3-deoxyphosphogalactonate aldolase